MTCALALYALPAVLVLKHHQAQQLPPLPRLRLPKRRTQTLEMEENTLIAELFNVFP